MSLPSGPQWATAACCSSGRCVLPSKKNTSSRTRSDPAKAASTSPNCRATALWTFGPSPYSWMRTSGCVSASSMDMRARSGAYSTSMSSVARSAVSSSTAATAATASPTIRTLSVQRASSSCDTGRMPNFTRGRSWPVITAYTPGRAAARAVSMRTIRAWGCGLRSSLPYAIRGRTRSSAYLVSPVTLAQASILGSDCPTMEKRLVMAALLLLARAAASTCGAPRARPRRGSWYSRCTGRDCRRAHGGSRRAWARRSRREAPGR